MSSGISGYGDVKITRRDSASEPLYLTPETVGLMEGYRRHCGAEKMHGAISSLLDVMTGVLNSDEAQSRPGHPPRALRHVFADFSTRPTGSELSVNLPAREMGRLQEIQKSLMQRGILDDTSTPSDAFTYSLKAVAKLREIVHENGGQMPDRGYSRKLESKGIA